MRNTSLHIDVIAVGKLKEDYWIQACANYYKRLARYAALTLTEVNDQGARSTSEQANALRVEASQLRRKIPKDAYVVMLDSAGAQLSSEGIADFIRNLQDRGGRRACFVLGGSWGLDKELKAEAGMLLSLGPITLPHNLARVVLLEQLYRAFKIITHEPYHK
jgi:23S rRNA (pseudouridine1915-N3)-methyltransferase